MIPAAVIAKLANLKLSEAQTEAVANLLAEVETATEQKAGAAIAARRAADRERKQRQREGADASRDITVRHVTSEDIADNSPPSASPLSSPPTPPPIIPLSPSPQTSLRSDTSASAVIVFFEHFWAVYPRKTEKKAAATKFFALVKSGIDPEAIIAGAERYAASKPDPKYTKHPTTWLMKGCWEDELLPRDGPPKQRGCALVEMAFPGYTENHDDQQHPSEHNPRESAYDPKAGAIGPDRAVSERGRDDGFGTLLDLRTANARWT